MFWPCRYPSPEALEPARAEEIFEQTLEIINQQVRDGHKFNLEGHGEWRCSSECCTVEIIFWDHPENQVLLVVFEEDLGCCSTLSFFQARLKTFLFVEICGICLWNVLRDTLQKKFHKKAYYAVAKGSNQLNQEYCSKQEVLVEVGVPNTGPSGTNNS